MCACKLSEAHFNQLPESAVRTLSTGSVESQQEIHSAVGLLRRLWRRGPTHLHTLVNIDSFRNGKSYVTDTYNHDFLLPAVGVLIPYTVNAYSTVFAVMFCVRWHICI